ncbi:MAG: hypothetical protein MJ245_00470 [Clostridia bacterium]|nr:hypothetical protein [Clostridia bacterium]
MKAPDKKVYIKTLEELEKKRFHLFGCEIHIPESEFKKMSEELNKCLIYQMNCFEFDD